MSNEVTATTKPNLADNSCRDIRGSYSAILTLIRETKMFKAITNHPSILNCCVFSRATMITMRIYYMVDPKPML